MRKPELSVHEYYMRMAMREAEKARGYCSPNPFVGAVIVKDGDVVSKGHTQSYGGDHAEVQAIRKAGTLATGADIYVTLEPCSHHGKTPPCTDAIIKAGISRVFYGIRDPNPLVNPTPDGDSPGIEQMRSKGIDVQGGILAERINRQLEAWLCRIVHGRPFVTLKTALSLDGKYAANDGSARWITGAAARRHVHKLRSQADVVLTGIGTVLADDPMLNVRLGRSFHQPIRAVVDSSLRIPQGSKLVQSAREYPVWVFHTGIASAARQEILINAGVRLFKIPSAAGGVDLNAVLRILHRQGCYSILAECGDTLTTALLNARLVDKVIAYISPKLIGGGKTILSGLSRMSIDAAILLQDASFHKMGDDILVSAYPKY